MNDDIPNSSPGHGFINNDMSNFSSGFGHVNNDIFNARLMPEDNQMMEDEIAYNSSRHGFMNHSISNIQLTPEAKRMMEAEIAYNSSGHGFWIQVVFGYVVSIGIGAVAIYAAIGQTINGYGLYALLTLLWLLLPALFISSINRSIKARKGPPPSE